MHELPEVASGPRLDLVLVSVTQLLSRDGRRQPEPLGFDDPDDVLNPQTSPLERRLAQVRLDPTVNPWLIRLAVTRGERPTIVGLANFHDRPDARGMVELGYQILPRHRRQGYGGEVAQTMWLMAAAHPQVKVLRACVRPDNVPSLRIVQRAGFEQVGTQDDPEDGLELIFERPAAAVLTRG